MQAYHTYRQNGAESTAVMLLLEFVYFPYARCSSLNKRTAVIHIVVEPPSFFVMIRVETSTYGPAGVLRQYVKRQTTCTRMYVPIHIQPNDARLQHFTPRNKLTSSSVGGV